jgi:hypothetical protein
MAWSGFKVESGGAKVNDWMFGEELSTATQNHPPWKSRNKKPPGVLRKPSGCVKSLDHQIERSGSDETCFDSFSIVASGERNSMTPGATHVT